VANGKKLLLFPYFYTISNADHPSFPTREWLVEGALLYLKFWAKLTLFLPKRRFLIDFRSQRLSRSTQQKFSIVTNRKGRSRGKEAERKGEEEGKGCVMAVRGDGRPE